MRHQGATSFLQAQLSTGPCTPPRKSTLTGESFPITVSNPVVGSLTATLVEEALRHNLTLNTSGGRALGGSSVTNGLFYGRGSKNNYEKWADLGNPGWGWNDTYPLFIKVKYDVSTCSRNRVNYAIEHTLQPSKTRSGL